MRFHLISVHSTPRNGWAHASKRGGEYEALRHDHQLISGISILVPLHPGRFWTTSETRIAPRFVGLRLQTGSSGSLLRLYTTLVSC